MANLKEFLGNKKWYCVLDYTIKDSSEKDKLSVNLSFDKKTIKKCKKAIRLSGKYFWKMEALGFVIEKTDVMVEEN